MFTELGVHFSATSEKLPYMVFRRMPNQKFCHFSAYLSDKIEKSPSPIPKMFSSQPSVTRHLNIRSKHYSTPDRECCPDFILVDLSPKISCDLYSSSNVLLACFIALLAGETGKILDLLNNTLVPYRVFQS
jgi:hypothetical protein